MYTYYILDILSYGTLNRSFLDYLNSFSKRAGNLLHWKAKYVQSNYCGSNQNRFSKAVIYD